MRVHQKRAEALRWGTAAAAAAAGTTWDGRSGTWAAATALPRTKLTLLLFLTTASAAITLALAAAYHLAVLHLGTQTHLVALLQPLAALVLLLGTHPATALAVLLAAALLVLFLSTLLLAAAAVAVSPTLASAATHHLAMLHLDRHDHLLALLKCPRALVLLLGTNCILLAALLALFSAALCSRLGTIVSRHCWFLCFWCKRLDFKVG